MKVFHLNSASLLHHHTLEIVGQRCELQTNSPHLASTLDRWLTAPAGGDIAFRMQVLVTADGDKLNQDAHFRGLHHLVVARFGEHNVFTFDLLHRNLIAAVSESLVADTKFWNLVLLPIAVGVMGAAIGTVPVHCACLTNDGEGMLVAGKSGAGKSTLSAALAQAGFDYVSDDWTYISEADSDLVAHGMAARIKLLPDTVSFFPHLSRHAVTTSMNGELAYEVSAEGFGSRVRNFCRPRLGIFLERISDPGSTAERLSGSVAREYLESSVERLPVQLAQVAHTRARIMDRISELPWWHFRYGGTPQFAAAQLQEFVCRNNQLATL